MLRRFSSRALTTSCVVASRACATTATTTTVNPKHTTSLRMAVVRPDLVTEWVVEENPTVDASAVESKSEALVMWRCSRGHTWQATVRDRVHEEKGCPVCAEEDQRMGLTLQEPIAGTTGSAPGHPRHHKQGTRLRKSHFRKDADEWDQIKLQNLALAEVIAGKLLKPVDEQAAAKQDVTEEDTEQLLAQWASQCDDRRQQLFKKRDDIRVIFNREELPGREGQTKKKYKLVSVPEEEMTEEQRHLRDYYFYVPHSQRGSRATKSLQFAPAEGNAVQWARYNALGAEGKVNYFVDLMEREQDEKLQACAAAATKEEPKLPQPTKRAAPSAATATAPQPQVPEEIYHNLEEDSAGSSESSSRPPSRPSRRFREGEDNASSDVGGFQRDERRGRGRGRGGRGGRGRRDNYQRRDNSDGWQGNRRGNWGGDSSEQMQRRDGRSTDAAEIRNFRYGWPDASDNTSSSELEQAVDTNTTFSSAQDSGNNFGGSGWGNAEKAIENEYTPEDAMKSDPVFTSSRGWGGQQWGANDTTDAPATAGTSSSSFGGSPNVVQPLDRPNTKQKKQYNRGKPSDMSGRRGGGGKKELILDEDVFDARRESPAKQTPPAAETGSPVDTPSSGPRIVAKPRKRRIVDE